MATQSGATAGTEPVFPEISSVGGEINVSEVRGDVVMPTQWTVFAPLERDDPRLSAELLADVPETITVGGQTLPGQCVSPRRYWYDFQEWFGPSPGCFYKTAYVFLELDAPRADVVTLGIGGDHWLQAWLNGEQVLGSEAAEVADQQCPPGMTDQLIDVKMRAGRNVLAVRFVSGRADGARLLIGGPRELRGGDFQCSPFEHDPRWSRPGLRAEPGDKEAVEVGSRRELFVDAFLIDRLSGGAQRRLHHPTPKNIALLLDRPWELPLCRYHTIVEDEGRYRLYYLAKPSHDAFAKEPCLTCLAESDDGITFERCMVNLHAFEDATQTNIIWRGRSSHNFTPFKDSNPNTTADARYKALADHPEGGGLAAFASADGVHWRLLAEKPVITEGAFDSQNLAFWDERRGQYVAYYREFRDHVRDVMMCSSDDFIHWSEPKFLAYGDDRLEHLYTNGIHPYPRAPHLYIGTPLRFVPHRTKLPTHNKAGLGDAILMSSRDGMHFERWEEAFIRPSADPGAWTDRKHEPAWGMAQTSPEELSLYWWEYELSSKVNLLRRGSIRTDGFVSVHAPGGDVSEMLTRPMVFSGDRLEVNFATSAAGAVMFELCDEAGNAIEGYTFDESEVLYGNEIAHVVSWWQKGRDVSGLAGQPVRLRVRMCDADLYSLRFAPASEITET